MPEHVRHLARHARESPIVSKNSWLRGSLAERERSVLRGKGDGGQPPHAIDDSIRPSQTHPRRIGARDSRVHRDAHDRRFVPTSWDRSDSFLVTGSIPFERTVSNYVSTQSKLQRGKQIKF